MFYLNQLNEEEEVALLQDSGGWEDVFLLADLLQVVGEVVQASLGLGQLLIGSLCWSESFVSARNGGRVVVERGLGVELGTLVLYGLVIDIYLVNDVARQHGVDDLCSSWFVL